MIVGIGPWRCTWKGIFVAGFEQKACNILPLTIQLNFNVAFFVNRLTPFKNPAMLPTRYRAFTLQTAVSQEREENRPATKSFKMRQGGKLPIPKQID
ncbi:hypothetical protein LNO20_04095 [Klebsiella quasipneumoniae subsp. quasipneumoniae]|nr:hypothetical protein [Klebsiella quasipneumoniae subsp. quasipneumoniae]